MSNILIYAASRYPISRLKIKKNISRLLAERGVSSVVEVSVLICGQRKARDLARKYLSDDKAHNVVSFPLWDAPTVGSAGDVIVLGDIAVCYPLAQAEANRDDMLVDDKIDELIAHGLMHLLGEHHDDK